jgi:hypothetical protein
VPRKPVFTTVLLPHRVFITVRVAKTVRYAKTVTAKFSHALQNVGSPVGKTAA